MNLTQAQLAEQAGGIEARRVLDAMHETSSQAERLLLLHGCLKDLAKSKFSENTLAGFSVAILPHMERGLGIR